MSLKRVVSLALLVGMLAGNVAAGDWEDGYADYQRRDFTEMLDSVDVPTFGMLQFQDEQTSSYAMLGINRLTNHNDHAWMTLSSGEHRDAVSPDTIVDLFQFLDLFPPAQSGGKFHESNAHAG